jgi:hypothetical protein
MNGRAEVIVMRRPVQRALATAAGSCEVRCEVREGTTGRVVAVPAAPAAGPRLVVVSRRQVELERVWAVAETMPPPESRPEVPVELAFYRKYTEALLRRYLRVSMSTGRVPSLMGRELFRGNVSHCRSHTMEDEVIFCMDMEKRLAKLEPLEQRLIARIALQHYRQGEAAAMLGLSLRSAVRRYAEALDQLTAMLLAAGVLAPLESCQEGGVPAHGVSC